MVALKILLALVGGVIVAFAETKCVGAIARHERWPATGYDLVLNLLGLAVIATQDLVVFGCYAAGSAVGTYLAVPKGDT